MLLDLFVQGVLSRDSTQGVLEESGPAVGFEPTPDHTQRHRVVSTGRAFAALGTAKASRELVVGNLFDVVAILACWRSARGAHVFMVRSEDLSSASLRETFSRNPMPKDGVPRRAHYMPKWQLPN